MLKKIVFIMFAFVVAVSAMAASAIDSAEPCAVGENASADYGGNALLPVFNTPDPVAVTSSDVKPITAVDHQLTNKYDFIRPALASDSMSSLEVLPVVRA